MADDSDVGDSLKREDLPQAGGAGRQSDEHEVQKSSAPVDGAGAPTDGAANDGEESPVAAQAEEGHVADGLPDEEGLPAQDTTLDQPSPQGDGNLTHVEDKPATAPADRGDGADEADTQPASPRRDDTGATEDGYQPGGGDGGAGGEAATGPGRSLGDDGDGDGSRGGEEGSAVGGTPSDEASGTAGNDGEQDGGGGDVESSGGSTALPAVSAKPVPSEAEEPGVSAREEPGSVELRTGRPQVAPGADKTPRGGHSHLALGVRPSVLQAATPLMERTGEIVPVGLSQLSDGEYLRSQIDLSVSWPRPAIVVVGTGRASESRKSHMLRLYQLGVLRAAGYSDVVVIDSGLNSCPSAARIRDKLAAHAITLGVSPPHTADDMLHKQHHRQLAVEAGDDSASESEETHRLLSCAKVAVADGIIAGGTGPSCRATVLVLHCSQDSAGLELLRVAEERDWRIILVRGVGGFGDRIGRRLDRMQRGEEPAQDVAGRIAQSGRVLCFPASGDPAELASLLHCCLVTSAV